MDQQPLTDRIAEALAAWAERGNSPAYAAIRRPETVTANARSRAAAVMAVVEPELAALRAAHASTVLEAQRQAKRADAAEARAEATIALSHSWLYHHGYPCPTPGNCYGGKPDPVRPCGCPARFGRHADGCPEQTHIHGPAARPAD